MRNGYRASIIGVFPITGQAHSAIWALDAGNFQALVGRCAHKKCYADQPIKLSVSVCFIVYVWSVSSHIVPILSVANRCANTGSKRGDSAKKNNPVHFLQAPFGSELECGCSYSTAVSGLAPLTPSGDAATLKGRFSYAFLYGAGPETFSSCEIVERQQTLVPAPPFSGSDGSIRKDSKSHCHKRYNIRPALSFLTFSRSGAILLLGVRSTFVGGQTAPLARFCHALKFLGQMSHTARMAACPTTCYEHLPHPIHVVVNMVDVQNSVGSMKMSKSALMPVEFHGATLSLINRDGKAYVAIKPICDELTLDWSAQRQRILRNPVLRQGMVITTIPSNGGMQEMTCLPLSMLNGWLFGINANRVKNPVIRQKLIEYQFECYDVLHQYWSGKTVSRQPEFSRMNLEALCNHMLFLEGWWHQYGPAVRQFNSRVAACVHDHFNDGAFVAAGFVNIFKLDVVSSKYAMNYPFHEDYQGKHQYYVVHGKK